MLRLYYQRNIIWRIRYLSNNRLQIFHKPVDLLMVWGFLFLFKFSLANFLNCKCSLFFADFLQAIGNTLNINWIQDGKVEVGAICNAQGNLGSLLMNPSLIKSTGILVSVGEAAVAITTVVSLKTNLESSILIIVPCRQLPLIPLLECGW